MPRNGSGTFNLVSNSWNPAVNGVNATAADWQTLANDLATGLTQSVSADGQTPFTGNLPMGNNKITGLAPGTSATDAANFSQTSGRLLAVRVIPATTTYTPTTGTNSVIVELVGGGAQGGGANATGAGQISAGSGGGAGGRSVSRHTSAFSGVTVTIGAGGSAAGSGTGSSGGTTSFGALATALGGAGGIAAAAGPFAAVYGGLGGLAGTGNIVNTPGNAASLFVTQQSVFAYSGRGAASIYGDGGVEVANTSSDGLAAVGFGGGGGGGLNLASIGVNRKGGAGSPGIAIIYEYA